MARSTGEGRIDEAAEARLGWSALAGPVLSEKTIGALVHNAARMFGERPFVEFKSTTISYAEAHSRSNRVANALRSIGIGKCSRVGILSSNRLEYLDLWFGLSKLGAIELPLNPGYKHPQLRHILSRAPVTAVVAEARFLDELDRVLVEFPNCRVVVLDDEPRTSRISYSTLIADASSDEIAGPDIGGTDVVAIMNTSGTTGLSKGVRLSHAQQYSLGQNMAAALGLGEQDVFYNYFPLFHNTAQAMITLPVMQRGARMVLTEKFSVSRFWPDVHSHGVTVFYFIGEMLHLLIQADNGGAARAFELRAGWGIGAAPKDMEAFKRRYGVWLGTCYGSTEGNVPVFRELTASAPPTSVGRVIPGFEIRIVDAKGRDLPVGEVGEVLERALLPEMIMSGYDGDPEATREAMRSGWYHTGDAGRIDEEGNFYFEGRIKDVIRVCGENVSGFEIEQELLTCPGVAEAAAIAVPGDLGGDEVKAVVVCEPGVALEASALVKHCEARLPKHFVPRYVEFRRELPKTETNKVRKHVLREHAFNAATWDHKRDSWIR